MKGMITGICCGALFFALYPLLPAHPILGIAIETILTATISVTVIAFWTGAVGIRWEDAK